MGARVIVADANLLVYLFVQGAKTDLAHRVSDVDDNWVVPSLWRHEFANALAMSVREAGLPLDSALKVYGMAHALLAPREQAVNLGDALRVSAEHAVSVYDAEYVMLAMSLGVRLVTEDRELLRKFAGTAISMQGFLDGQPGEVREKKAAYSARRPKRASGTK